MKRTSTLTSMPMAIFFLFSLHHLHAQNVGIGTASPVHKLQVVNTVLSVNAIDGTNNGSGSGTSWDKTGNFAGVHGEAAGGTAQYQAGVYGFQLGNGSNSGGVVGAYSAGVWGGLGYTDGSGNNWGVYTPAGLYVGGNVGIGTLTPLSKLHVAGSIRMVDGNQAANKVMVSDANGTASWQTLPASSLGGSGATDFVAKFTPNGTTVGNSLIFDNGTNVGINNVSPVTQLDVRTSVTLQAIRGQSTVSGGTGIGGVCNTGSDAWGVYGESTTGYAGYFNGKLRVTDKVGIGTIPSYTLDATGNLARTGNFVNTAATADNYGIQGSCNNTPYYGFGVAGYGGFKGVVGEATLTGAGNRYGLYGLGANGTGSNYGMYATAANGATAYGVYGEASGAATNWAGYFASGNVYVQNMLGIGTITPYCVVDVIGTSYITGRFENSSSDGWIGLRGTCMNEIGMGVEGHGGYAGVSGTADRVGNGSRVGLDGNAQHGEYNYGVRGTALAGGFASYGVYGHANQSAVKWAGYFVGNVFASGTFTPSDRKLKSNIHPLTGAMAIIDQLNPTIYTFKTTEYQQMHLPEGMQYGLIADELQRVLPDVVKKAVQPAEFENHDRHTGKKISDEVEFNAVNYTAMIPILIGAVKELNKKNEALEKQNVELIKRIEALEKNTYK